MQISNYIIDHFSDINAINNQFENNMPIPIAILDNFLPRNIAADMSKECDTIPDQHWTIFNRHESEMLECKKLEVAPVAFNVTSQLHSSICMGWLEKITNIPGLIPDPYITGAGYSKILNSKSLKTHTDFNWNDQLRLHRILSLIIYLNPDWQPEYGGDLNFYDFNRNHIVKNISPIFNRAVLWKYHKRGFHGTSEVLCPETITRKSFRLFFYVSNAVYNDNDRPHRSLYWYDNNLNEPYDIPTQK